MSILSERFCSWCFQSGDHAVVKQNYVRRNVYQCAQCDRQTLQCAAVGCRQMACGDKKYDDNFCAEHDGKIASFTSLSAQLGDIAEFNSLFEGRKTNYVKAGKIAGGAAAGALLITPLAFAAAPSIAAFLGGTGLLGAAGTGAAISSLSGAALTSASLASIGAGSMAAGVGVVTAVGGALGGYKSAVISNGYMGGVGHFRIKRLRQGGKHAVIVVNGFLSQDESNTTTWEEHLFKPFSRASWYHTDWEATNLRKLGKILAHAPETAGKEMAKELAKRASKAAASKMNPMTAAMSAMDLIANPWHVAMVKAQLSGVILADAIARTHGSQFTLIGHSLGARVIYYALEALSTKNKRFVKDVYLLGGAVDGSSKSDSDWERATTAVKGRIYNCHSEQDLVLKFMYQGATGMRSRPIGFAPIALEHDKVFNFDCTALVDRHNHWKPMLGEIFSQLKQYQ